MKKNSQEQSDGIEWATAALSLGAAGIDLRRPDAPGVLSELLNARFVDAKTVGRRGGHTGRLIQDYSAFTQNKRVHEWVYGHGNRISLNNDGDWENVHHPIHSRGGGTFEHGDKDLVWTGDRLFVTKEEGPFHGGHSYWSRLVGGEVAQYGIPAYLPVQEDRLPADALSGTMTDMCLTDKLQVFVQSTSDDRIAALITNRETGAVIDRSTIDDDTGAPTALRVVNSGGVPMALWLQDGELVQSYWNGSAWSAPTSIETSVGAYDVAVTSSGCHVAWRVGGDVFIGKFLRENGVDTPYPFGVDMLITAAGEDANGNIALAVSPGGHIALVWEANLATDALLVRTYEPAMGSSSTLPSLELKDTDDGWAHLTACYRLLKNEDGHYPLVVHAAMDPEIATPAIEKTWLWELVPDAPGPNTALTVLATSAQYNANLATKSFRVGDEVFCWMRTLNGLSHYLIAGVANPRVCGIADREEALSAVALPGVTVDPLVADGTQLVWARRFNAGTYTRPGNVRLGFINFLPALSAAPFGRSVYLAGSHVLNWDGVELGDAGFQDYPTFDRLIHDTTGSLEAFGLYFYRVYAVRYNKAGERFQSVAQTSIQQELGAGNQKIVVHLTTTAVTNHDDVVFEVYRTENGGTTYRLEGTVANDKTAAIVQFNSVMSDADLLSRPADPHAPGLDSLAELEELGPIGCETLIAAGDRLWCIGGQVPAGIARFSKLYEVGEGAGFDSLDGYQIIDATGGRITTLAGFGDTAVVASLEGKVTVMRGGGPNNYGVGSFGTPELVVADGAISGKGTVVLPVGIAFWGAGGPRVLGLNFRVENISDPITPLSATMTPTGVTVDLVKREVVWYTAEGGAVLWNYAAGSRWARWSGLPIAGCSSRKLVTTDGRVLTPSSTPRDDGRRFEFKLATGNLRPEQLLLGKTMLHRVGMAGKFNGPHSAKFKVFYDDAPLWSELFVWHPTENTFLATFEDFEDLTPAEVDALSPRTTDYSGQYATHRRVSKMHCRFFRIEVSDCGDDGFTPWELHCELGGLPGSGRIPANTFTE